MDTVSIADDQFTAATSICDVDNQDTMVEIDLEVITQESMKQKEIKYMILTGCFFIVMYLLVS